MFKSNTIRARLLLYITQQIEWLVCKTEKTDMLVPSFIRVCFRYVVHPTYYNLFYAKRESELKQLLFREKQPDVKVERYA
jgi:hypothetical protein